MKTINTLSVFITFCLAVLITLFLASAKVQAANVPTTTLVKAEAINKATLNKIALETLDNTITTLAVTVIEPKVTLMQSNVAPVLVAKQANKQKIEKVSHIAE